MAAIIFVLFLSIIASTMSYLVHAPYDKTKNVIDEIDFVLVPAFRENRIARPFKLEYKIQNRDSPMIRTTSYDNDREVIAEEKNEIEDVDEHWKNGRNTRVMVNGKPWKYGPGELAGGPEADIQEPSLLHAWLLQYCRIHPKCNLRTLLEEMQR